MSQGMILFRQLQGMLPWSVVTRSVAAEGGDYKVHRATCRSHMLVLLLAMLLSHRSLREIENGLSGRLRYLKLFGVGSVDRSTLFEWAQASADQCGVKLHVFLDHDGALGVLADEIIRFNGPKASRRCHGLFRLITYYDAVADRILQFLTNQMTWSALTARIAPYGTL